MATLVQADTTSFDEWLTAVAAGGAVTKIQHNTAVVQFAASLDLFLDPFGVLTRDGSGDAASYRPIYPSTATETSPGTTALVPRLGGNASAANLTTFHQRTGNALFEEQKRYVGAMAWQLLQMQRATITTGQRTGAALMLAIPAGYYVLAGIAAAAGIAIAAVVTTIRENAESTRVANALAGAGQDYAARLATYRETGSMPAASTRETAAAAVVQSSADSFWTELGRGLGSGVQTGSKWVMGAAAIALLLVAVSSTKGANRE